MASLCFSHWAAINSKTSIHRSRKTEEYRPIALCVVCAIPHRAQPMIYYAGVVTSETCFVKWHQHITSNWVNRAHWPAIENKQKEYIREDAILQKLDFSDWAQDPGFPKFRIPDFSFLIFNIVVFACFCPDMLENHCKYCYFWATVSKNLVNIVIFARLRRKMLEKHCKYCCFWATVSENLVNIFIVARVRPKMLKNYDNYFFSERLSPKTL